MTTGDVGDDDTGDGADDRNTCPVLFPGQRCSEAPALIWCDVVMLMKLILFQLHLSFFFHCFFLLLKARLQWCSRLHHWGRQCLKTIFLKRQNIKIGLWTGNRSATGRIWNLALDDLEKMMLRKNCDLVPGADMEKQLAPIFSNSRPCALVKFTDFLLAMWKWKTPSGKVKVKVKVFLWESESENESNLPTPLWQSNFPARVKLSLCFMNGQVNLQKSEQICISVSDSNSSRTVF